MKFFGTPKPTNPPPNPKRKTTMEFNQMIMGVHQGMLGILEMDAIKLQKMIVQEQERGQQQDALALDVLKRAINLNAIKQDEIKTKISKMDKPSRQQMTINM
jgi:hypothetical protein